jgi:MraZ protein
MFVGTYHRTLDTKGRIVLPTPLREGLEGGAYITRGRDGCLVLFPKEGFENAATGLREISTRGAAARKAVRAFFNGAAEGTPDRQGRVGIPEHLRQFAGLEDQVVIGGVANRIEIWDAARYQAEDQEGMDYLNENMSEVNDLGI